MKEEIENVKHWSVKVTSFDILNKHQLIASSWIFRQSVCTKIHRTASYNKTIPGKNITSYKKKIKTPKPERLLHGEKSRWHSCSEGCGATEEFSVVDTISHYIFYCCSGHHKDTFLEKKNKPWLTMLSFCAFKISMECYFQLWTPVQKGHKRRDKGDRNEVSAYCHQKEGSCGIAEQKGNLQEVLWQNTFNNTTIFIKCTI